ncbi:MAG: hypothetical protein WCV62_02110 [Candidatus Peribacteraceae bacterium]|jgi:hypothetical protein
MTENSENNGHWQKSVESIAHDAQKLVTRGAREVRKGGLKTETESLLYDIRDRLNELLAEWEEEAEEDEERTVVEDSLMGLYGRFRVLLEGPRKPPVKARPPRRNTHRVGETTLGRMANVWESH